MTIKEAILQSLSDLNKPLNYMEIYTHIMEKNYYPGFQGKNTPESTVSAQLGDFIRNGDTRIKRIKEKGGTYVYYLTKEEQNIGIDILTGTTETIIIKKSDKSKTYDERDLHKLLLIGA